MQKAVKLLIYVGNAILCVLPTRSKQTATRVSSVAHFRAQMILPLQTMQKWWVFSHKWSWPIHTNSRSQSDQSGNESVRSVCEADLIGGSGNIKMRRKFLYPKEPSFPQVASHSKRDLGMAQCYFQAMRWFSAQSFHQLSDWFWVPLMKLNIKRQIFHKHR